MASPLPGYEKLPGKARRYRTPTGETISRRQYENLRFAQSGWESWSDYQRTARTVEYQRFARAYSRAERTKMPWYRRKPREKFDSYIRRAPTRGILTPESEFNEAYLAARREGFSHEVGGAFDKFLQMVGLRSPDVSYDVGDTP